MNMDKHMRAVLDHLWGPTGSVILHIILVVLLVNFLVFETRTDQDQVVVQMRDLEVREQQEIEEILADIDDIDDIDHLDQPTLDDAPPEPTDFQDVEIEMDVSSLDIDHVEGPLVLRGLFAGRTSSGRARMLNQFGGRWGDRTQASVVRALEWLKRNQIKEGENRGSWHTGSRSGKMYNVTTAGLGLLAFLAHGETTGSERYGETVLMAIEFLERSQQANGAFNQLNQHGVYAHGIGAYAISEAYAMTRIPPLREAMDKAIQVILDGQQPGGGWDYHYRKGNRRDVSVSAFQVQALKAAYMAGSEVEGIDRALELAAEDIRNNTVGNRFRYATGVASHCSTSIAVLCMQLIGHGRDNVVREAMQAKRDERCTWQNGANWDMYKWYYLTQAKFHTGGGTWRSWNEEFAPAYIDSQQEEGYWVPPVANVGQGYGDAMLGRAFPTALAALTLQVYYRFLPTYQETAIERIEIDLDEGDDEITIDII